MLATVGLGLSFPEVWWTELPPLLWLRYRGEGQEYVVAFNFHSAAAQITLPGGSAPWSLRFNTAASRWGGPETDEPATAVDGAACRVPGLACLVFHRQEEQPW